MIEMLKRPEGATVEQIAAATGWQHHTIRGAICGALKKKLGLTVEATRTREVGPNKTGAKGSSTVYRITGSERPAAGGRLSAGTNMHGLLEAEPGYRLHPPRQPGGRGRARRAGPQPAPTSTAPSPSWSAARASGSAASSGSTTMAVFGTSREGWRPDLPDACDEPFIPLLWLKVHELLGRVPEGSTARFLEDGTLPD